VLGDAGIAYLKVDDRQLDVKRLKESTPGGLQKDI
jgi:hypothetical protein